MGPPLLSIKRIYDFLHIVNIILSFIIRLGIKAKNRPTLWRLAY